MKNSFIKSLEENLRHHFGQGFQIISSTPVSGGDINEAFRLQTTEGNFFIKTNSHSDTLSMFEAEAKGLALMTTVLGHQQVAQPVLHGEVDAVSFLLLQWIETGNKQQPECQRALGRALAKQHQHRSEKFGLDHDNFIGILPQSNLQTENWADFFIEHRLKAQLTRANPLYQEQLRPHFDQLFLKIPELYPEEKPSLLHGDLWGGNYLCTPNGSPLLIDPAVYYGHREMDIAMTTLFGGFSDNFYSAYQEVYPLSPGWENRLELWNLYPLLVHLNLFGQSYLPHILKTFAGLGC